MHPPQSKLPQVGTTIFSVMTQLASEHNAVNLSQGFPDFDPPARLIELVAYYLSAGPNQYAPMPGVPALREAIAGKLQRLYGLNVDPTTDITITPGATEALFAAIHSVVRPGDEVVVFDPAYDAYEPAITLAGGTTIHLPLMEPLFSVDWDRLARALNERTRLVIVNTPHNPTGAVLAPADLDRLAELLRPWNCLVLSDEVYEHIVFDGAQHTTVLAHPELAERSFAVYSFGKTFHATGWKTGYCVAPAALSSEFRKVHQYVAFCAVTPLQYALADFLDECPEHYLSLSGFYAGKRDLFLDLLGQTHFKAVPAHGTYFQLVDYSAISDLPDVEFVRGLTKVQGVAGIPVSGFYAEPTAMKLIRFCFAKDRATLEVAAERLAGC